MSHGNLTLLVCHSIALLRHPNYQKFTSPVGILPFCYHGNVSLMLVVELPKNEWNEYQYHGYV